MILKWQAWMDSKEFESKILGAIVKEHLKPTNNYVPDKNEPLLYNKHKLLEGSIKDFVLDNSGSSAKEASAKLQSLGKFSFSGEMSEAIRLEGKLIRYKRLQQVDQFWKQLVLDEEVVSIVPEWSQYFSAWLPCLVVGIMICEDVEVSFTGEEKREVNGTVQVPIDTITLAAGIPNPLGNTNNPEASLGATHKNATIFKATMGKGDIFALELQKITTKAFRKKHLRLHPDGPVNDPVRLAGPGPDDEDDDDDKDIFIDELDPQDFTAKEYAQMTVVA